jgi:MFS family permease
MRAFLAAAAWFGAAIVLVVGAVIALFWIGFLHQISILFYRGLVLIAIGALFCFVVLVLASRKWPIWKPRDAVSASAFACGVAVCLLIVLPVTIDRSVSVFILTRMAALPDRAFTPDEMRAIFTEVYLGRYQQIERRLEEQEISGNVARDAAGYRITPQGLAFVRLARFLSTVFQTDPRFVTADGFPKSDNAPARADARVVSPLVHKDP